MKNHFKSALIATGLALATLFISQFVWIDKSVSDSKMMQNNLFQACFNESVSDYINMKMGKTTDKDSYTISELDRESVDEFNESDKYTEIDAGKSTERKNISLMIEDALIIMLIGKNELDIKQLDSVIYDCLEFKEDIMLSKIWLINSENEEVIEESSNTHLSSNKSMLIGEYISERKVSIPNSSYTIRVLYVVKQSDSLSIMSNMTLLSIIAAIITISVLFFLLYVVRNKERDVQNMQRAFHGAIHDLKSPLAYVYLSISILEEKEIDMDKKTSLILMNNKIAHLSKKINLILQVGKNKRNLKKYSKRMIALFDVAELVQQEMRIVYPEKHILFKNDFDIELSFIASEDLFESLMRIILENSIKYNGNGPIINIKAWYENDKIVIVFKDNGFGIPKRNLKTLFKAYYTTDNEYGNGIGLYMVKNIISSHGGQIYVKSIVGEGTIITIILPDKKIKE